MLCAVLCCCAAEEEEEEVKAEAEGDVSDEEAAGEDGSAVRAAKPDAKSGTESVATVDGMETPQSIQLRKRVSLSLSLSLSLSPSLPLSLLLCAFSSHLIINLRTYFTRCCALHSFLQQNEFVVLSFSRVVSLSLSHSLSLHSLFTLSPSLSLAPPPPSLSPLLSSLFCPGLQQDGTGTETPDTLRRTAVETGQYYTILEQKEVRPHLISTALVSDHH